MPRAAEIPERVASWCKLQGVDLEDPYSIAEKIALAIHSAPDQHDYFRSWICRVPPEQRTAWYDLLCAHVKSFMRPKSLNEYIIMQQQKAEREQLPTGINEQGEVIPFKPARTADTPEQRLAKAAEKAIRQTYEEEQKGRLSLTCSKCTTMDLFYAKDRAAAVEKARMAGWVVGAEQAYCPECARGYEVMDSVNA